MSVVQWVLLSDVDIFQQQWWKVLQRKLFQ